MLFLNYRRKYPIINGKDYSSSIGIENEELKKEESKVNEEINEDNDTNLKERPVKIVEKENN